MNSHAITILDLPRLLELVAQYAHTRLGQDLIGKLKPDRRLENITRRHGLYRDLMGLYQSGTDLPSAEFASVSALLRMLEPAGAVAAGDDLVTCCRLLEVCSQVKRFLAGDACLEATALQKLASQMTLLPDLHRSLHKALEADGTIKDDASETLRRLRKRSRTLTVQMQTLLEGILQNSDMQALVQSQFVTIRSGRYVIPVKREFKSRVNGIVHDHSDSGQTLFIEPAASVPLGNELAETLLQEKDECRRILIRLSDEVRTCSVHIRENERVLSEYDAAQAVSRWAVGYGCRLPVFGKCLILRGARHPLLAHQFRQQDNPEQLIPLNLALDTDLRVLAITGSNSGGKTVVLKTVGLLTLAAQAGLPIPVEEGSEMPLFDHVFADIGDEQSIAENLSTFTGHLTQIQAVLKGVAHGRSLVLLDELGSGTDPLEGGALACAILEDLSHQPALTLATTHLGVVKTFVHEHRAMLNAAVRFNPKTLQPDYILEVGQPGASHAFSIAKRLGLPARVLSQAEKMLNSDHLKLEGIIAQLEEDQRQAAHQERTAQAVLSDLKRDRNELRDELKKLRQERRRLMHEAYQQAANTVENTREQMEKLLNELHRTGLSQDLKECEKHLRQTVAAKQEKLARSIDHTRPRPAEPLKATELAIGQKVWIEKLQSNGRIVELPDHKRHVMVEVGHVRFTVKRSELGRHDRDQPEQKPVIGVSRPRASGATKTELNLIGLRTDEAIPRLDHFLNQAALAGLHEIRIVHGFGTGRLQRAVHEHLRSIETIKSFRLGVHGKDPGGAGATIVNLERP